MIGLIIYLIGYVVCVYPMSQFISGSVLGDSKPDSFDRGMGMALGVLVALFWPAILTGYFVFKLSKRIWTKIVGEDNQETKLNQTR